MATDTVHFKHVGDDDKKPYQKIDMVKACRLGNNVAVSFYQLDYQGMVNAMAGVSTKAAGQVEPLPVSKLVMDLETFKRFKVEIDNLHQNMLNNKNGNDFNGPVN